MVVESCSTGGKCMTHKVRRIVKWALLAFLTLGIVFIIFMVWLRFYHPNFIYNPMVFRSIPEYEILGILQTDQRPQILTLTSPDETKLRAYWLDHSEKEARKEKLPVLLFLHGNDGDVIRSLLAAYSWQRHMPVNVLVLSYRGYGYSGGEPSMKGVRMDSQTALDYLLSSPDVDPARIMLYGHSLGGAVALHLAAANVNRFLAVFVENTFLSIPKMATYSKPALQWFTFLVTEIWDNEEQIRLLASVARLKNDHFPNIMFISGDKDHIVPPKHMDLLWQAVQAIAKNRPDLRFVRKHLIDCRHTCFPISGYFESVSEFYYGVTGEQRHRNALVGNNLRAEGMKKKRNNLPFH